MKSPPFPRYLIPPRSKYSPQHPVLKHPQLPFLPHCQRPNKNEWGEYFTSGLFCLQSKLPTCACFLTYVFYREGLLVPRPTPKLEDHPSSAVRDCLFNLSAATLLIGGRSSIRNLRTRHAVVTGTHNLTLLLLLPVYLCYWFNSDRVGCLSDRLSAFETRKPKDRTENTGVIKLKYR